MQDIIFMDWDWILILGSLSWLTCKLWLPILRSTRPRGRAGPPPPGGDTPAEQPDIKQILLFISTKIILLSSALFLSDWLSDLLGSVPVLVQQPRQHLQQGHGGGGGVDVDSPPQTVLSSYLWQLTNCAVLWCCEHWQSADNQYNECGAAQRSCNVVFVSWNIAFRFDQLMAIL